MDVHRVKEVFKKFVLKDQLWGRSTGQPFDSLKKAAVLVPLVLTSNGLCEVWLTKRSQIVRHDKGHVCFPGGMFEEGDKNEVDTALREANEEIGLEAHEVEVIGAVVPYINLRKILVVPVIAIVNESFQPKPNPEVEIAFKLPLNRFLENIRYTSSLCEDKSMEEMYILHQFEDCIDEQSVVTFGLTAWILIDVATAVFNKRPDFDGTHDIFCNLQNPFERQARWLSKMSGLHLHEPSYVKVNL